MLYKRDSSPSLDAFAVLFLSLRGDIYFARRAISTNKAAFVHVSGFNRFGISITGGIKASCSFVIGIPWRHKKSHASNGAIRRKSTACIINCLPTSFALAGRPLIKYSINEANAHRIASAILMRRYRHSVGFDRHAARHSTPLDDIFLYR